MSKSVCNVLLNVLNLYRVSSYESSREMKRCIAKCVTKQIKYQIFHRLVNLSKRHGRRDNSDMLTISASESLKLNVLCMCTVFSETTHPKNRLKLIIEIERNLKKIKKKLDESNKIVTIHCDKKQKKVSFGFSFY